MQVEEVSDKLSEIADTVQDKVSHGQENLAQIDAWLRQTVRTHPTATLVGFLGLGYLVGRIVARR